MLDIIEFVRAHRGTYQRYFEQSTLRALPGASIRCNACDPQQPLIPFSEWEIRVSFTMKRGPTFWAMNTLYEYQEKRRADIRVAIDLLDRDISLRKFVLAKEWLEVMLDISDVERRRRGRSVDGRIGVIELYHQLGQNTFWKDDEEESAQLKLGLQHLLLPDETVVRFLHEYDTGLNELKELVRDPSCASKALHAINGLERGLASAAHVTLDLASLRLRQILFDRTVEQ